MTATSPNNNSFELLSISIETETAYQLNCDNPSSDRNPNTVHFFLLSKRQVKNHTTRFNGKSITTVMEMGRTCHTYDPLSERPDKIKLDPKWKSGRPWSGRLITLKDCGTDRVDGKPRRLVRIGGGFHPSGKMMAENEHQTCIGSSSSRLLMYRGV